MMPAQPAIRVAVNDRQLPVAAVFENGRVLVPFRAVVEALGGSVSAFRLPLRPPARVIAGRTYAPIRFLATTLHAQIQYDGRAHLVQVFTSRAVAGTPAPTSSPIAPTAQNPRPGTRVGSAYPTISADLGLLNGISIARIQLLVDGADVTTDAHYAGTYVTYIPRNGLPVGTHTVAISGVASDGRAFVDSWSFETTQAPAPSSNGTSWYPGVPNRGGFPYIQLNVWTSQVIGGAPISVNLTAPPGGEAFAFVCTSAYEFPLYAAPNSEFYNASVPTEPVTAPINCPVTAMYVGWNGQVTYAPYPVFVRVIPQNTPAPPTPTPTPTRIPLPTPIATRTPPKPTPTPSPRQRVKPPGPPQRIETPAPAIATAAPAPVPTVAPRTPRPSSPPRERRGTPGAERTPKPHETEAPSNSNR